MNVLKLWYSHFTHVQTFLIRPNEEYEYDQILNKNRSCNIRKKIKKKTFL